jgi:hypothetical protein
VRKSNTSAEPSSASAANDGLATWDFDEKKLKLVGDFVERMRKAGATGCRVGPVSVAWDGPPVPEVTVQKDKRKPLTERDILMHSA